MRISRRAKKIAFFVILGACLVGLTVALNVTWIVLKWREVVPLVLGIIFFALIIAGIVVYTVFLVREIHKNEQQDSFLNAVTHELKTPIASTWKRCKAGNSQRRSTRTSIESCSRIRTGFWARSSKF